MCRTMGAVPPAPTLHPIDPVVNRARCYGLVWHMALDPRLDWTVVTGPPDGIP